MIDKIKAVRNRVRGTAMVEYLCDQIGQWQVEIVQSNHQNEENRFGPVSRQCKYRWIAPG